MFSQFFGNYLLENQKITAEQFSSCMEYIKANRVNLELIAEREGLLSHQQVTTLKQLQMQEDRDFGDLAIKRGYLSESDVDYLLGLRGNLYLIFIQALEENQCLTTEEIDQCMADFQKDRGFSDAVMKAIQDGDIEKFLPAFVDTPDDGYLFFIGLTLRSIVRFISPYIQIGKGHFVSSFSPHCIARQRITGDSEGFLGFCCDGDDDGILAIADGYAKEHFDTVDEDALDSAAEFVNCVNGLYAAELSFQNISIDMEPPELLFDTTIQDDNDFYVLPVYIEGRKLDLIIKISKKEK